MAGVRVSARVNLLRTQRLQLDGQVESGADTKHATASKARAALATVEAELDAAEREAREEPGCDYLFKRTRKPKAASGAAPETATGRTDVSMPQCVDKSPTPTKEDSMASKSKAAQLEETLDALRRAEKSAGTTKWALSGAGAAKNPPTPARKKALKAKLDAEQKRVAELRTKRDKLRAS